MSRPARVRISLPNLLHNCRQVKAQAPDSSLMAVIKADAYGHGALACARALHSEADALAVATVGEGIALREGGIQDPVTILHGAHTTNTLTLAAAHRLDLVVHDMRQVKLLEQTRRPDPRPHLWLKVETGMHRLGIGLQQAETALARLQALDWMDGPVGLMTHLACADEVHDTTTATQLERFSKIPGAGARSAANSAATLRYPESRLDWTRPGLALYGVTPENCPPIDLRPVMTLEAPLLTIRDCRAGDRLGYGGAYTCPSDMRVGLIEAGYADGYPHASAGRTQVAVNGARHATLGRVSMDLLAVDLTDSAAAPGDWTELWGAQVPVQEIAKASGTIAYELLTRAGHLPHERHGLAGQLT